MSKQDQLDSAWQEQAAEVSRMFGEITPKYDFQNHLFSLGQDFLWRRRLSRELKTGSSGRMADLAAGTLDVSLEILRKHPNLHLTAVDICRPMLEYGYQHKVRPEEKDRIEILVADARSMPLADSSLDAVSIAFGIRNIVPRSAALDEMLRVLVPGGQILVLEFAPLDKPMLGPLYHWYLKQIMPRLGSLICKSREAMDYFAESIRDFPKPADFLAEVKEAGFIGARHNPLSFGIANLYIAYKPE